ncbi:MAG: hypothetical protein U1F11_01495 [Steroidobacteraceae bacterium]
MIDLLAAVAALPLSPPPHIVAQTALAAAPPRQSLGPAGPINRFAFDLTGFSARDTAASVECLYGSGLRYRCNFQAEAPNVQGEMQRIIVDVPDLGRGDQVRVRFSTAHGADQHQIGIANPPQTIHEIEAVSLPDGGQVTIGPNGQRAALTSLLTLQSETAPALTALMPYEPTHCDQIYAEWSAASASEPVFASEFGPLNGAITLVKPVLRGSPVRADNLPRWLITYPASATRMQFIAHYEVRYRVGVCSERVLR